MNKNNKSIIAILVFFLFFGAVAGFIFYNIFATVAEFGMSISMLPFVLFPLIFVAVFIFMFIKVIKAAKGPKREGIYDRSKVNIESINKESFTKDHDEKKEDSFYHKDVCNEAMEKCPRCGTPMPVENCYCDSCGTLLRRECFYCGTVNNKDNKVCSKCGSKL